MSYQPGDKLKQVLRRPGPVLAAPVTAFDHVMLQRVNDLTEQVDMLQKQLWASLGALIIAVVVNVFRLCRGGATTRPSRC